MIITECLISCKIKIPYKLKMFLYMDIKKHFRKVSKEKAE